MNPNLVWYSDMQTLPWMPPPKQPGGRDRKEERQKLGVIIKFNLFVLYHFWELNRRKSFLHNWRVAKSDARQIITSVPAQFTWHSLSGTVIISATRRRDEAASPLASSRPAALQGWGVKKRKKKKQIQLRGWLELREAEREEEEEEEGDIRDEAAQSARGRAEAWAGFSELAISLPSIDQWSITVRKEEMERKRETEAGKDEQTGRWQQTTHLSLPCHVLSLWSVISLLSDTGWKVSSR